MKISNKISAYKEIIGITLGIVAAIAILFTQSFYYDIVDSVSYSINIVDADEDAESDTQEILTVGQNAVSSVVQVSVQHALHFISDLNLENSEEIEVSQDEPVNFNSLFKTLFRLIISPNAP